MKREEIKVNPDVLLILIELSGYNVEEISQRLKIPIENINEGRLSISKLKRLADILKRPLSAFFSEEILKIRFKEAKERVIDIQEPLDTFWLDFYYMLNKKIKIKFFDEYGVLYTDKLIHRFPYVYIEKPDILLNKSFDITKIDWVNKTLHLLENDDKIDLLELINLYFPKEKEFTFFLKDIILHPYDIYVKIFELSNMVINREILNSITDYLLVYEFTVNNEITEPVCIFIRCLTDEEDYLFKDEVIIVKLNKQLDFKYENKSYNKILSIFKNSKGG